jgi:hypothetical protein
MEIICRCDQLVLDGKAPEIHITFNKNDDNDHLVMWISTNANAEEDDLTEVSWEEARSALPEPDQVDILLAEKPHGVFTYDKETREWASYSEE